MKRDRVIFIALISILSFVLFLGYYNLFTCNHCKESQSSHCSAHVAGEESPDLEGGGCALSLFNVDESDYLPVQSSNLQPLYAFYSLYELPGTYLQQSEVTLSRELAFFKGRGSIHIIKTVRLLC